MLLNAYETNGAPIPFPSSPLPRRPVSIGCALLTSVICMFLRLDDNHIICEARTSADDFPHPLPVLVTPLQPFMPRTSQPRSCQLFTAGGCCDEDLHLTRRACLPFPAEENT